MAKLVMRLPAITTEMDEGRLLTWMVTVGQAVKEGDPICEFTTDKVDTELESPYTGTITKLLVPEGGSVRVGDAIALIEGDAPNFLGDLDTALAVTEDADPNDDATNLVVPDEPMADEEPGVAAVVPAPRAVRLEAERRGIALDTVTPTGSRGQVTMADLDAIDAGRLDAPDAPEDVIQGEAADWADAAHGADAASLAEDVLVAESASHTEPAREAADDQGEMDSVNTVIADPADERTPALEEPGGLGPEDEVQTPTLVDGDISLPQESPMGPAVALEEGEDDGEPSLAAQRPQERRSRRAERTGGRRRSRRRQATSMAEPAAAVGDQSPAVDAAGAPNSEVDAISLAHEPVTLDPPLTVATPTAEAASSPSVAPVAAPPVVHEVRVEHAPPFTLYAQLDVTDLQRDHESGLALLSRLVWAYGQALWEQPDANAMWDHQHQSAVTLDTVYVDLGLETVNATMETVPIAVPKDAPIAQIGLSVTNAYGLVRQGTPPEVHVPQRSATLIDLGPWRVERFTPVIQPPQVTALSVGEMQTVPSLVGRTVTIRQFVTMGLTIDTRVLDPVQAASLLATIIDHATRGDGLDQPT